MNGSRIVGQHCIVSFTKLPSVAIALTRFCSLSQWLRVTVFASRCRLCDNARFLPGVCRPRLRRPGTACSCWSASLLPSLRLSLSCWSVKRATERRAWCRCVGRAHAFAGNHAFTMLPCVVVICSRGLYSTALDRAAVLKKTLPHAYAAVLCMRC